MSLGPLTVGVNADGSGFANSAMQALLASQPQLTQGGLIAGSAIGTAIGSGITSAISGAINLVQGAITGLAGLVQSGLGLADSLADTSLGLGVAASSLLLFREAATQAGADTAALEQSIGKFNIRVGEAKLGSDVAISAFAAIGISVAQLNGLNIEQQFVLVANALGQVSDTSVRAALAMDIFGKSGAPIAKALGAIATSTGELADRWIYLGAVITEQNINAAGAVADKIDLLTATFDRFSLLLAAEMSPLLITALNWIDKMVVSAGGLAPAAEIAGIWVEKLAGYTIDAMQLMEGMGYILVGLGQIAGNFSESWKFGAENLSSYMDIAIGHASIEFGKLIDFTYTQFKFLAEQLPDIFEIAVKGIVATLSAAFTWIGRGVKLLKSVITGTASWINPTLEITPKIAIPQKTEIGEQLAAYGSKLSSEGSSALNASLAKDPLMKGIGDTFNKGLDAFNAVLGGGPGRRSTAFMADVAAQRKRDKANGLDKPTSTGMTNQQLIDQRNAWQSAAVSGGSYSTGGSYSPMVSTPSMARNGIAPTSSYGPPVTVNQQFQTGVTTHELKQAAQTIKRETIAAVQQKNAAGGTFRNNLKC